MSYVMLSEDCLGHRIEFIENNGILLNKPVGRKFRGTVALQDVNDSGRMRLFFADTTNIGRGALLKLVKIIHAVVSNDPSASYEAGNANYTCLFEYTKSELDSGKKKIKYCVQIAGIAAHSGLFFYDFKHLTGVCYVFEDIMAARNMAKKIGLTEIEYLDYDGALESVKPLV